MKLTELYLRALDAATQEAIVLHNDLGSWLKVEQEVGELSSKTWRAIAEGSKAKTPRISTLMAIGYVQSNSKTQNKSSVKRCLSELQRSCKSKLCGLAKTYGRKALAEMLRIDEFRLVLWMSKNQNYIPEFRYLLAIDSIDI